MPIRASTPPPEEDRSSSISRTRSKSDVGYKTKPGQSSSYSNDNRRDYYDRSRDMDDIPSAKSRHKHSKSQGMSQLAANLKPINFEKERPIIMQTLASANLASTNLMNALSRLNREVELPQDNQQVVGFYRQCRQYRKQILIYIQRTENEEWIGTLINANDNLVKSLQRFEEMRKPPDMDSDSEGWSSNDDDDDDKQAREIAVRLRAQSFGMDEQAPPPKPPRPSNPDEDDGPPPTRPPRPTSEQQQQQQQQSLRSSISSRGPKSPQLGGVSPSSNYNRGVKNGAVPSLDQLRALKPKPPPVMPKPANITIPSKKLNTLSTVGVVSEDNEGDDPFGDKHTVESPAVENKNFKW